MPVEKKKRQLSTVSAQTEKIDGVENAVSQLKSDNNDHAEFYIIKAARSQFNFSGSLSWK